MKDATSCKPCMFQQMPSAVAKSVLSDANGALSLISLELATQLFDQV